MVALQATRRFVYGWLGQYVTPFFRIHTWDGTFFLTVIVLSRNNLRDFHNNYSWCWCQTAYLQLLRPWCIPGRIGFISFPALGLALQLTWLPEWIALAASIESGHFHSRTSLSPLTQFQRHGDKALEKEMKLGSNEPIFSIHNFFS
jgi:hypothetical protein